jgi:thioredoxin 1
MPHTDITTKDQLNALLKNNGVAVIDCHATWCGPCKMIAPKALQWAEDYGVLLIKIDVDQAEQLSAELGVKAMPTFFCMKG